MFTCLLDEREFPIIPESRRSSICVPALLGGAPVRADKDSFAAYSVYDLPEQFTYQTPVAVVGLLQSPLAALSGFQDQRGPVCAATSVANALNWLHSQHAAAQALLDRASLASAVPAPPGPVSDDERALAPSKPFPTWERPASTDDILALYQEFVRSQVAEAKAMVLQRAGCPGHAGMKDLDDVLPESFLSEVGASLKYSRASCNAADAQIRGRLGAYFIDFASKRAAADAAPAAADAAAGAAEKAAEATLGPFGSVMYEFLEQQGARGGTNHAPVSADLAEVMAALRILCRKLYGLAKLSRSIPKASTGCIGNWGLLQAAKALSRVHQVDLRGHTLLRRKSKFAPAPAALLRMIGAQLASPPLPPHLASGAGADPRPRLPPSVTATPAANGSLILTSAASSTSSSADAAAAAAARLSPAAVKTANVLAAALGADGALTPYGPAPYITQTFHSWALTPLAGAAGGETARGRRAHPYLPVYGDEYRVPAFIADGGAIDLAADNAAGDRDMQWQLLCHAVAQRDTAIIYHLKNHYACVFAVREALVPAAAAASCENDVYRFYTPKPAAADSSSSAAAGAAAAVAEDPTGWFVAGEMPADIPVAGKSAAGDDDDEDEAEEEEAAAAAAPAAAPVVARTGSLAPLGGALPPLRSGPAGGALQPLGRIATRRRPAAPAPVLGPDGKPLSVRERLEMRRRGEKPAGTADDAEVGTVSATAAANGGAAAATEDDKENSAPSAGADTDAAQSESVRPRGPSAPLRRRPTQAQAAGHSRRSSAPEAGTGADVVVTEDLDADDASSSAGAAAAAGAGEGVYPPAGLKLVRQVLVARKGQLPRWWVDFDEIHRKIANGKIFCMMAFKIALPVADDVLDASAAPGPAGAPLTGEHAAARAQGKLPAGVDTQERAAHWAFLKKHAQRWAQYKA